MLASVKADVLPFTSESAFAAIRHCEVSQTSYGLRNGTLGVSLVFQDHYEPFWPGVAAKYHGLRSANAVD